MIRGGMIGVLGLAAALISANSRAAMHAELLTKGFILPVCITAPPGDSNRLFVLEQHLGRIRIIDLSTRTIQSTPFITITNLLTGSEQGLLGLAFHPNFRSNGYFYINQVSKGGPAGHTEISRYQVQGDPMTSNVADRSSRKLLLSFDQPQSNHNAGWMGFGPDGYLYISQGDGGGGDDQHGSPGNGQSRSTYLGKILRLDVDAGDPYGIPDGNPFKGSDTFKGEIWAFGLRNPWRCGFDRLTGDLWIGDVGQNTREEVDVIPAGLGGINFGWRVREGLIQNPAYPNESTVTPARNPICDYDHSLGNAIIGGYVYRGSGVPELQGKYIFADNGSARFWTVTPNGTNSAPRQEITSLLNPSPKQINSPTAFGEDANGELYICDYDGEIYKITSDAIHLAATRAEGFNFVISFSARAGQAYTLEANSNLSDSPGTWSVVTNIPPNSANSTISITNSTSAAEQYFRVRGN